MEHFHYTYVLFSEKDHLLYIGFTSNLEKRIRQHNEGLNVSTRSRRPLKLIYFEGHLKKTDALKREAYFKTTSGKRSLKIMLKNTLSELGYAS
jgi:putative endonuclease